MALSLDDKLLGEKVHYYCSSSEDEGGDSDGDAEAGSDDENQSGPVEPAPLPPPDINKYDGRSTNTGPKGVLTDWRRFKQLETEKRQEQEVERLALAKKLSLTCRSNLDDERAAAADAEFEAMLNDVQDEFLEQYRRKRIEEMRVAVENLPRFGKVIELTKAKFVEEIDKEKPQVTIFIHLYEHEVQACEAMNGCLACLAQQYPTVKFCRMRASEARLSSKFSTCGVPAILIYKKGDMIGNFVRISDVLGEDFFATDLEAFLLEHGMLPDKTLIPGLIRVDHQDDGCGSDFEMD